MKYIHFPFIPLLSNTLYMISVMWQFPPHTYARAVSASIHSERRQALRGKKLALEHPNNAIIDDRRANITTTHVLTSMTKTQKDEHSLKRRQQVAADRSISTTFLGGSGQSGCMFDIIAKTDLTIMEIDVHTVATASTDSIEVWTKHGSLSGYESSPEHWYMIGCTDLVGSGFTYPTPIAPEYMDWIKVKKGATKGIYTSFVYPGSFMQYSIGEWMNPEPFYTGDVFTENQDLQIIVGAGKTYYFGAETFKHRIWNGILRYAQGLYDREVSFDNGLNCRPSMAPSNLPSVSPSLSNSPSIAPTIVPSEEPTTLSSLILSSHPSQLPSAPPTVQPTRHPSAVSSALPSYIPSLNPSLAPSFAPSNISKILDSFKPSISSTDKPSHAPSFRPNLRPSWLPSKRPSLYLTFVPSSHPSTDPSKESSLSPSELPSKSPSIKPSHLPTMELSSEPSMTGSIVPSINPSIRPSLYPSSRPRNYFTSLSPSLSDQTPSVPPSIDSSDEPSQIPISSIPSFTSSTDGSLYRIAVVAAAAAASASTAAMSSAAAIEATDQDYHEQDEMGKDFRRTGDKVDDEEEENDIIVEGETEEEDRDGKRRSRRRANRTIFQKKWHLNRAATFDQAASNMALGESVRTNLVTGTLAAAGAVSVNYAFQNTKATGPKQHYFRTDRAKPQKSHSLRRQNRPHAIKLKGDFDPKVILLSLSQAMTHARVLTWLKMEGDRVNERDCIVIIEGCCGIKYVTALQEGYIAAILVEEGKDAEVGQTLALIGRNEDELHDLQRYSRSLKREQIMQRFSNDDFSSGDAHMSYFDEAGNNNATLGYSVYG